MHDDPAREALAALMAIVKHPWCNGCGEPKHKCGCADGTSPRDLALTGAERALATVDAEHPSVLIEATGNGYFRVRVGERLLSYAETANAAGMLQNMAEALGARVVRK